MALPFDLRRLLPDPEAPPARRAFRRSPPPAVEEWLTAIGFAAAGVHPLAGDVGLRRYWRLELAAKRSRPRAPATAVLVVYPHADRAAGRRFEATTSLLSEAGVRVPRIFERDLDRGWMVVEDLGPRTLFELRRRPWDAIAPYFGAAARVCDRLAELPVAAVRDLSPPLDTALLRRELERTRDVFLEPLGLLDDAGFAGRVETGLDTLCRDLGAASPVACHRDFMVRNLVPLAVGGEPEVGVLDHQDLRLGPPGYDLASLYNDSLFPPPEVERTGVAARTDDAGRTGYHRVAAQRTLKAVGTYAAFATLGDDRYLGLIAPTLSRSVDHLEAVADMAELAAEARLRWAPVTALLD